jgi:hypothetical protein
VVSGGLGLLALGLWAASLWRSPGPALGGYLAAYMFWLGLSLGALGLLLLLALLGGSWEAALRPVLTAAARAVPLLLLLFLPLLAGMGTLYPWLHSETLAADEVLRRQTAYLNRPFFLLRAAACFAVWLWLVRQLRRPGSRPFPSTAVAASGALLMLLSVSVAAIDWVMSLQPEFRSASYGLTACVSAMLAALALALACRQPVLPAQAASDAGGLLLMLVLAWSYLEFMSYLTVWSADLPPEIAWYLPRTQTSWRDLAAVMLLQSLLPLALLLSRRIRQSAALRWIAAGILIGNACEAFWRVRPAQHPAGLQLVPADAAAMAGIGGLWLALFLRQLRRVPETAHA